MIAADFVSQQLTPFEAFAFLDTSRSGVLRLEDFAPNLTAAVPAVSLQQARAIWELMMKQPSAARRDILTLAGVTLSQFEKVFPLRLEFPATAPADGKPPVGVVEKAWYASVVDRMARHLQLRGVSQEEQNHSEALKAKLSEIFCTDPRNILTKFSSRCEVCIIREQPPPSTRKHSGPGRPRLPGPHAAARLSRISDQAGRGVGGVN